MHFLTYFELRRRRFFSFFGEGCVIPKRSQASLFLAHSHSFMNNSTVNRNILSKNVAILAR